MNYPQLIDERSPLLGDAHDVNDTFHSPFESIHNSNEDVSNIKHISGKNLTIGWIYSYPPCKMKNLNGLVRNVFSVPFVCLKMVFGSWRRTHKSVIKF